MRVLITGARGRIGQRLTRLFSRAHRVAALERSDLDVTDPKAVRDRVFSERPNLVVNCAVLGVDACEKAPDLARAVNAQARGDLARAAASVGARLVHFSSNYVFGGLRRDGRPYTQEDRPEPVNTYGRTKLEGEQAVAEAGGEGFLVRTSWVFGRGGGNILSDVPRRLRGGERVRAIEDTWASPTFLEDLAARVLEIVEFGRPGLYHVVNEGHCSYLEFARAAARILGLASRAPFLIEPVPEAQVRPGAPRPAWTPMRCLLSQRLGLAPMRSWEEALQDYIRSDISAAVP